MSSATRTQRRYDHRLKNLVQTTGNLNLALESGVPRSTAYGWLSRSQTDVITIDVLDAEISDLQKQIILLRRRNTRLIALLRLVITVMNLHGLSLARVRVPEENRKIRVLRAIEQARVHFTLRTVLRVIGVRSKTSAEWKVR